MEGNDVRVISTTRILDDFLSVDEAIVEVNGLLQRRLSLERGDSVAAIVRRTDSDAIVLVRQFRYPTYEKGPGWILEIVAGMVDDGETPDQAIRREVNEELGFELDNLAPIAMFYPSPGGSSERVHLFYTEVDEVQRTSSGGGLDCEQEEIEIVNLSPGELRSLFDAGQIADAKTLIAVQWLIAKGMC